MHCWRSLRKDTAPRLWTRALFMESHVLPLTLRITRLRSVIDENNHSSNFNRSLPDHTVPWWVCNRGIQFHVRRAMRDNHHYVVLPRARLNSILTCEPVDLHDCSRWFIVWVQPASAILAKKACIRGTGVRGSRLPLPPGGKEAYGSRWHRANCHSGKWGDAWKRRYGKKISCHSTKEDKSSQPPKTSLPDSTLSHLLDTSTLKSFPVSLQPF